jgi:hypothetical protein
MFAAPHEQLTDSLDALLEEAEQHRELLTALGVGLIVVAALTPLGSFVWTAAIASSTFAGTGGVLGYISHGLGWTHAD